MWDTLLGPSADRADAFRAGGHWRSQTILDDLSRAAQADPERQAIISYTDSSLDRIISYRELRVLVDRGAGEVGLAKDAGDEIDAAEVGLAKVEFPDGTE